jgi:phage shock protein PspC (stress-responsive transcriptional regulator)
LTSNAQSAKRHAKLLLMVMLLILFLFQSTFTRYVNAQLSMPEEQVNYTITRNGDVMWAKIDGTYPITYSGAEEPLLMVYPTPPGTTNISITLNDLELGWSSFTEAHPEEKHHTAIGDWQMISTVLEPVTSQFILKIHYEHPVQVINGSYVFLYDLNIAEYLSVAQNKSVAHFEINMDTNYSNLKVNTVDVETETLKPIEYTTSGEKNATIKIDETSEFDKQLPGDLLISFSEPTASNDNTLLAVVLAFVVGLVLAGLAAYILVLRRRDRQSAE